MSAIAAMITGACLNFSGNSYDACAKAAEAGAKQSGFEQTVDSTEKDIAQKTDTEAKVLFGEDGVKIVGSTVFLAKTVADKKIKFDLPNLGICDKISNEVGVDKYVLNLEWGF